MTPRIRMVVGKITQASRAKSVTDARSSVLPRAMSGAMLGNRRGRGLRSGPILERPAREGAR